MSIAYFSSLIGPVHIMKTLLQMTQRHVSVSEWMSASLMVLVSELLTSMCCACRLKGRCTGQWWRCTSTIMTVGNKSVSRCWNVSWSSLRRVTPPQEEPPGQTVVFMPALMWTLYFCPVVSSFFLLSIFFSSPNLSGCRLDVYYTCTHGVALMRL